MSGTVSERLDALEAEVAKLWTAQHAQRDSVILDGMPEEVNTAKVVSTINSTGTVIDLNKAK